MASSSSSSASSSASSGGSSRSSASSSSYVNAQGAGGSSSASATSPGGKTHTSQQSEFVPGATSASSNASASASGDGANTSAGVEVPAEQGGSTPSPDPEDPAPIGPGEGNDPTTDEPSLKVLWQFGTADDDVLESTEHQDLFWAGPGADRFVLATTGVTDLHQADLVFDYIPGADSLALRGDLTGADPHFEVVDLDGDSLGESTAIRSLGDDTILGVVVNTADAEGQTLLTAADFGLPPQPGPATAPPDALPGSGATSSPGAAEEESERAATDPESIAAVVDEVAGLFSEPQAGPIDILTGIAGDNLTTSPNHWEAVVGGAGADQFILSANTAKVTDPPDLIMGFSAKQGDKIKIPGVKNLDEIYFESLDLNQDGYTDSALLRHMNSAKTYGIILNAGNILELHHQLEIEVSIETSTV
jgi:hypothetical protein